MVQIEILPKILVQYRKMLKSAEVWNIDPFWNTYIYITFYFIYF